MYACMYDCMYDVSVCMYACVSACFCICMYVCHLPVCVYVCMYVCIDSPHVALIERYCRSASVAALRIVRGHASFAALIIVRDTLVWSSSAKAQTRRALGSFIRKKGGPDADSVMHGGARGHRSSRRGAG